jgi:hypothetical protein
MESIDKDIWVGKRTYHGEVAIYVFDSRLQSNSQSIVNLFDIQRKIMREFQKNGLRNSFETIKDLKLREQAIKVYVRWLIVSGEDFAKGNSLSTSTDILTRYIKQLAQTYSLPVNLHEEQREHTTQTHEVYDDDSSTTDDDFDDENELILDEKGLYNRGWAKSSDDGWFYSDTDDDDGY